MMNPKELENVIRRTLAIELTPGPDPTHNLDRLTAILATRIIHRDAELSARAPVEYGVCTECGSGPSGLHTADCSTSVAFRHFSLLEEERRTPITAPPSATWARSEAGAAGRAAWLRDLADPRKPNECRCEDGQACTRYDCRNTPPILRPATERTE
jgi:hypothetical protein